MYTCSRLPVIVVDYKMTLIKFANTSTLEGSQVLISIKYVCIPARPVCVLTCHDDLLFHSPPRAKSRYWQDNFPIVRFFRCQNMNERTDDMVDLM